MRPDRGLRVVALGMLGTAVAMAIAVRVMDWRAVLWSPWWYESSAAAFVLCEILVIPAALVGGILRGRRGTYYGEIVSGAVLWGLACSVMVGLALLPDIGREAFLWVAPAVLAVLGFLLGRVAAGGVHRRLEPALALAGAWAMGVVGEVFGTASAFALAPLFLATIVGSLVLVGFLLRPRRSPFRPEPS